MAISDRVRDFLEHDGVSGVNFDDATDAEEFLEHYGVPGMKWGRRKRRGGSSEATKVSVSTKTRGGKAVIKTKGGENQPASKEAISTAVINRKGRKSGTAALSNKEMQAAVKRMKLEKEYKKELLDQQGVVGKLVSKLITEQGPKELRSAMQAQKEGTGIDGTAVALYMARKGAKQYTGTHRK